MEVGRVVFDVQAGLILRMRCEPGGVQHPPLNFFYFLRRLVGRPIEVEGFCWLRRPAPLPFLVQFPLERPEAFVKQFQLLSNS